MDVEAVTAIAESLCETKGWSHPAYIAHGNSAAVYRLEHPEYGLCALKVYDPRYFEGDNAVIEVERIVLQRNLRGHGNGNLIETFDAEEVEGHETWYLLMEFCGWPTLDKVLSFVPQDRIHTLIKKLVDAVLFLESQLLIHRDIKPANISISADFKELKLLDLGVLRHINQEEGSGTDGDGKKRFIATAQYSPPEYLTRDELPGMEGFSAINIYQCGAILHDFIMRRALYQQEAATGNKYIVAKAVTSSKPRIFSVGVPARLLAICNSALLKDPTRRLAAVKLTDFLAEIDDVDALRRRVSNLGEGEPTATSKPSLLVWQRKVETWIRAAARRERDFIGVFTLSRLTVSGGVGWKLGLTTVGREVFVELLSTEDQALVVNVIAQAATPLTLPVLEIGSDGVGATDEEAIGMIAEHILYAIDLSAVEDGNIEEGPDA